MVKEDPLPDYGAMLKDIKSTVDILVSTKGEVESAFRNIQYQLLQQSAALSTTSATVNELNNKVVQNAKEARAQNDALNADFQLLKKEVNWKIQMQKANFETLKKEVAAIQGALNSVSSTKQKPTTIAITTPPTHPPASNKRSATQAEMEDADVADEFIEDTETEQSLQPATRKSARNSAGAKAKGKGTRRIMTDDE